MDKKKKGYFWMCDKDAETGLGVVARSVQEAKTFGYSEWASLNGVEPETFIEQRCKWSKKADVSHLPLGVVEPLEGLKCGLYSWVEDEECPICNEDEMLTNEDGFIGCSDCTEKNQIKREE